MKDIKERDVVAYFIERWEALGGAVRKCKWIGQRNAPDTFAFIFGFNCFIEFKAPSGKLSVGQKNEINNLREAGVVVEVISSFDQVNKLISKAQKLHIRALAEAACKEF